MHKLIVNLVRRYSNKYLYYTGKYTIDVSNLKS